MRALVALAFATASLAVLAPSVSATCMEHGDRAGVVRTTSCSPPGGPVTTTTCVLDLVCHTWTSGEDPPDEH